MIANAKSVSLGVFLRSRRNVSTFIIQSSLGFAKHNTLTTTLRKNRVSDHEHPSGSPFTKVRMIVLQPRTARPVSWHPQDTWPSNGDTCESHGTQLRPYRKNASCRSPGRFLFAVARHNWNQVRGTMAVQSHLVYLCVVQWDPIFRLLFSLSFPPSVIRCRCKS